ncbi:MAG: CPBP family intramembrane glutamic endopeptidase [Armatimonadota bacterium]|nr:CPBP family intramembrane glutamic endopeptidase [Armatimonadota bacterium]MDR7438684.1 CPBP family intramembrane glutamic endopeptidase [Armatimonadota bacterium]MDR7563781.1 CPBP family intramembrane glutamic endopeptidase [Armatimonadota bacterium]MDR7568522.1 CPBP family intramembrane glutamic endopeptidase [Armatimonadota bacterium]MDR7601799.1 CPBP family intramembrane glutamic endopeptidase [Armatimonadota bacterium]
MAEEGFDWREFLLLSMAGITGAILVIPYSLTLQAPRLKQLPVPLQVLIPIQVAQNAVFIAMAVGLGLLLAKRTGLGAPLLEAWLSGERSWQRLKGILPPSVVLGAAVALIVVVLDVLIFASRVPRVLTRSPQIPVWEGFLASFYGGITEELFMRLGLFSLLVWLLTKVCRTAQGFPSTGILWTANVLVAVLFGLGHLPATAMLVPLTPLVAVRAVALNGLASLAFGYLYWTRGLEAAMLAHFTADVVLHVAVPLLES